MALQFILGSSGAGKSWTAYHEIIQKARENPGKNYLILVPEQFTMQTQKELVSMHPDGGILNIDVLSFQRLAYRIFEETGKSPYPLLEETGKSLVLQLLAQEKKESLTILGTSMKKPGAVSEMKSLVSELKQYCIDPDDLRTFAEDAKGKRLLGAKLRDVEILYRAFNEYLSSRYVTAEDVLEVLVGRLSESEKIRGSEILVDGFTGFTPVQINVLGELFCICKKVSVTVILDEREDPYGNIQPHHLFAMSRQLIRDLSAKAREVHCEILPEYRVKRSGKGRFIPGSSLDFLEQNLFRYRRAVFGGEQDAVHIRAASDPRKELEMTARIIRRYVRERGYRYKDFAVLAGDLSVYGTYAKEIFGKNGIPYFVDEKHSVLMNPFVEFLRSAVDMVVQSFSYESVFRYLRCGLSALSREETDRMENYVLALGIRGKKQYEETWTRNYRGQKPDQVPLINELRQKFLEETGTFAAAMGQKGSTVRERNLALYYLVEKCRIQEKLKERESVFHQRGEEALAKEYAQIYEIVMNLLDKMTEILGDETPKLSEYQQILEAGFTEASVGIIPPTADEVLVGDNERTRLKDIRVLFFVGVNDGLIPRVGKGGGVLSDHDREELKKMEVPLSPTAREEMYMQRFHLYRNLTRPQEELHLSFARTDAGGRAAAPSYLIGMIRSLYPSLQVLDAEQQTDPDDLLEMPVSGINPFLEGLSKAVEGEITPLFAELYRWYLAHPEADIPAEEYCRAAFSHRQEGVIGKSAAAALYGQVLTNSATRLEQYAACAFAHFVEYGLQIRERVRYEFRAADMGTVMHEALERFSKKLAEDGQNWRDIEEGLRDRLIEESVREVLADYGNTILASTSRNRYQAQRITRILKRTVWALQEQIRKGDFQPGEFEISFAMEDSLSAINVALSDKEKLRLRGRIDRVDLCEKGDKIYVKIIDYKSGNTTLDLASLYYGLQLQLPVYLDAVMELEQKKHPEKEIVPAGIFYYHIGDPMLDKKENETEEEWRKRLLSALRMDGLVNGEKEAVELLDRTLDGGENSGVIPVGKKKDGSYTGYSKVASREDFDVIRRFTELKIREIGRGILDGETGAAPYQMGQKNACTYCSYRGICGFDQKVPGYAFRRLRAGDGKLVLAAMRHEVEEEEEQQETDETDRKERGEKR